MQDFKNKNIVIIGNKGRMGGFFSRKFKKLNLQVQGIDVPLHDSELATICANAHIALLCVPAAVLEDVVKKVCPHLPSQCILTDITSVKVQALLQMQKHWQGPIVGTHPLFGEKPSKGSELTVAIVPDEHTAENDTKYVEELFTALGCKTFRCTAKKHDMAMAAIQNLNFITSLVYFASLAGDEDLLPFITPSFKRRQDAAQKLLTNDAELFTGLFAANPYSHEYVQKYKDSLNLAAKGDIETLVKQAAWWWE